MPIILKNISKYFSVIFIIYFIFGLCSTFVAPVFAETETAIDKLNNIAVEKGPYAANASETTAAEIIGTAISIFLGLLGIIFIALTLYAGFNYMTAQGNDEKITKALATLRQAVIGLIITVSSYAIWNLIYTNLLK